jgi:FixJ family two-component response regulator
MVRVAIVEDETSNARAVARLLRASGMESMTFASAEEYLERADASEVDCVVLDIQLGGMSGFDLQSKLAVTHPDLPVIFLSAHEESETLARARFAGCPFVKKSEPGQILLAVIRGAVAERSRLP